MTREVDVTVTFLECNVVPGSDSTRRALPGGIALRHECAPAAAEIAASMYREVGGPWHWIDRRAWTANDWAGEIHRDGVELWSVRDGDRVIGYFELHVEKGAVDIRYFGLVPDATGRGIGGPMLTAAMHRAAELGGGHVTVNTCTLDHPSALPNYLARGFHVVRTEVQRRTLPS